MRMISIAACACALASASTAQVAGTTTVTFESGAEGWSGSSGSAGGVGTFVDPTGGNPDSNLHTIFNDFGITYRTSSNSAFVGDFSNFSEITFSVDVNVNSIGFFGLTVSRDLNLQFIAESLSPSEFSIPGVNFNLGLLDGNGSDGYVTYSTTFDPRSTELPAGWVGIGAEDPDTFETILPEGITFADVMANVSRTNLTTLTPGFFFGFADHDVQIDNITITAVPVPAPGAATVLAFASAFAARRRRCA